MTSLELFVGKRVRTEAHTVNREGGGGRDMGVVLDLLHSAPDQLTEQGTVVGLRWTRAQPLVPGAAVVLERTITRCRREQDGSGLVNQHLRVTDGAGGVLQEGTMTSEISAEVPLRDDAHRDFCTTRWAAALADLLADNEAFGAATQTFDGSIALRAGDEAVQLRVYRARVVDCSRWTPKGPTFTLSGDELAWVELVESARNDYISRAMRGRFSVSGNTYEYLRLTKALVSAWDSIRQLATAGPTA